MIYSKLRKDGDDFVVPLPKRIVKELNLKANQEIECNIYTLNKLRRKG